MIRKTCWITILLSLLCVSSKAFAYNSFVEAKSNSYIVDSCDSFAWINNSIYIAHGNWDDNDSWTPTYYQIYTMDIGSGIVLKLHDGLRSFPVLFVEDNDKIYLLTTHVLFNNEGSFDTTIMSLFSISDLYQPLIEYDLGNYIEDYIMYEDYLIIATEDRIIALDVTTGCEKWAYSAENKINSQYSNDHFIIENDQLYFLDGLIICRIDLETLYVEKLATIDTQNESEYHNAFIVLDGILYYWDADVDAMVSKDLRTGEASCISKNRFCFLQYYENGIIVFEIDNPNLATEDTTNEEVRFYDPDGILYDDASTETTEITSSYMRDPTGSVKYYKLLNGLFLPNTSGSQFTIDGFPYLVKSGLYLIRDYSENHYSFRSLKR